MKCCECNKSKANYKCDDCGEYYCEECAEGKEMLCDCISRNIILMEEGE